MKDHAISFFIILFAATLSLFAPRIVSLAHTQTKPTPTIFHAVLQAQTSNPTFSGIGTCPGNPACPSNEPSAVVRGSVVPSKTVVNPSTNKINPSPSVEPCKASDASIAAHHDRGHHKLHDGSISGFMETLLRFFMQLINLLLQLFGINLPTNPIPTPEPASTEALPIPCSSPSAQPEITAPLVSGVPSAHLTQAPVPSNIVSRGCALPEYPNASCTGVPAGTSLTVVNGNMEITTANTVIDSKDIRGCVNVRAPGVIIRKSKISCSGAALMNVDGAYTGTGLLVEDTEIDCKNMQGTAVGEANITARRVNIHGCENGFDVNQNIIVEDSYIHDLLPYNAATDPHTDGLQMASGHFVNGNSVPGSLNVTIRHNTIYVNDGTSAIISNRGADVNILIQDNLMAGGAYTLYCEQNSTATNYRVINNHFSTLFYPKVGAYGPWTDCEDETQVTGNVYHETGLPVK